MYTLDDGLPFQDGAFSPDRFVAGQLSQLVLTRDDATDTVRAYLNGTQVWSFVDTAGDAVFSGPDRVMRFFPDDNVSSQAEAQSGFVDRVRIFDRVLTNAEITQLANPPAGPPASDQRGYPYQRVVDGNGVGGAQADMGAFEWQQFTPAALLGDYNLSGTVDAADYTVWQDLLGTQVTPYSYADGNGNGTVDSADYAVWVANVGQSLPAAGGGGVASLAEPLAATPTEESGSDTTSRAMRVPSEWLAASSTGQDRVDAIAGGAMSGGNSRHELALLAWLTSLDAELRTEDLDGESGPPDFDNGLEDGDLDDGALIDCSGSRQVLGLAFAML